MLCSTNPSLKWGHHSRLTVSGLTVCFKLFSTGEVYDMHGHGVGSYKYIDCLGTEQYLSDCSISNSSGCQDSQSGAVGVRCNTTG